MYFGIFFYFLSVLDLELSEVILNKLILIVLLKMLKDLNMINNFYNLI